MNVGYLGVCEVDIGYKGHPYREPFLIVVGILLWLVACLSDIGILLYMLDIVS